jgi:hypothetical protein
MKKFLLALLVLGLLAGATTVWATVIGTPHDLAPEPCAMCHTPHNGMGQYPLWNRSQGTQSYSMYTSFTFDMGPAESAGPRYPSNLCLVCHNGVASELVNYPGPCSDPDGAYDLQISGCADLGTNLGDDHPISFNYWSTADVDNDGFPPISSAGTGTRAQINGLVGTYPLYGTVGGENNWFECATCHSVHDVVDYNGKGDYQVFFLRADNTGSAMCLDCHQNR